MAIQRGPAHYLERLCAYGARFAIAARNLGPGNACRVFLAIRGGSKLCSIHVPRLARTVHFRGAADKGAISHFFYPGARILDAEDNRVRTIVDAGANIGVETIRMMHFHPGARVLAIEADGDNFAVLEKNARQYGDRVGLLSRGLWSSAGSLRVLPGSSAEGFTVRPALPGEPADLHGITMREVVDLAGGEIDILKMDIEGAEYEAFTPPAEWVRHVKAFIIECPDNDHPGATARIFEALAGLPFDASISGENLVLIRRDTGWRCVTSACL